MNEVGMTLEEMKSPVSLPFKGSILEATNLTKECQKGNLTLLLCLSGIDGALEENQEWG